MIKPKVLMHGFQWYMEKKPEKTIVKCPECKAVMMENNFINIRYMDESDRGIITNEEARECAYTILFKCTCKCTFRLYE